MAKEMPAGREMDALIAEKIMGYTLSELSLPAYPKYKLFDIESGEFSGYVKEVPHYSTDIAASWEVTEKITDQKHWAFKLRRLPGKDYMACFIRLTKTGRDDFESKPSKTAPFAICRAALKAMGGAY